MRYSEGHKAIARARIVETASREFRRRGTDISVVDLMRAEGLTHGGLYRHFKGKEALLIEAVEAALDQVASQLLKLTADTPRHLALKRVVGFYLSEEHVAHPESGCALAALGTEIGRYPKRCRARIASALDAYRLRLQGLLPGKTESERKAQFDVLFPSMAGCLMASRAQADPDRRKQILQGARSFFVRTFCGGVSEGDEETL
jgi:TetR/AcrR family transcriptional regulator, transcriptional repressor for nem operon